MIVGGRAFPMGLGDYDPAADPARDAWAAKWAQVITTTDQAKAALGFVAQELHTAYEAIQKSDADWRTREEMRQLLDGTNKYAQELYADVEVYDDQGLDFSDAANHVGRVIGWLYADTDRQLQLASRIADFYESGWSDAFWQAVGALPGMAKETVLQIVDTAHQAVNKAIGWPEWFLPTVAAVGVLGVGAWAYVTFLAPASTGRAIRNKLASIGG
jgi:hypothetical protein